MTMRIDILTLFPQMFSGVLGSSILNRASSACVDKSGSAEDKAPPVQYHLTDIRDFTENKHSKVDAPSFGGGPGMVMQCQPVWDAVQAVEAQDAIKPVRIVTTPQGQKFNQRIAEKLSQEKRLLIIAGHYEGIDQRVIDKLEPEYELSIGDYVLSGGELAAMVIVDSVVRLLPGVLGDDTSAHFDSFSPGSNRLLDHPHYTRPRNWKGMEVPQILLSGNHQKIAQWRKEQSLARTKQRRPDLLREL